MITQRLSCDNFPSKGNSNFSGEVGVESTFRYIFPGGGTRILSFYQIHDYLSNCQYFSKYRWLRVPGFGSKP